MKKWMPARLEDAHPRWIDTGGMSAVSKFLAENQIVRTGQKAMRLEQKNGWTAHTESGEQFSAKALVVTVPAPQAFDLLKNSGLDLPETFAALRQIEYFPCLAVLARLDRVSALPAPGSLAFENQPVAWMADNFQKGISPEPTVTIHASPAFSQEHLDGDLQAAGAKLLELAKPQLGAAQILDFQVHRWWYSLLRRRYPEPFFKAETEFPLLFGGDGFGMGNVEGAFLPGLKMGEY